MAETETETQSKFNTNTNFQVQLNYGCGHNFKYAMGAKTVQTQKIFLIVTVCTKKAENWKTKTQKKKKIRTQTAKNLIEVEHKKSLCLRHFCVRIAFWLTVLTGHSFCRQFEDQNEKNWESVSDW